MQEVQLLPGVDARMPPPCLLSLDHGGHAHVALLGDDPTSTAGGNCSSLHPRMVEVPRGDISERHSQERLRLGTEQSSFEVGRTALDNAGVESCDDL